MLDDNLLLYGPQIVMYYLCVYDYLVRFLANAS